MDLALYRNPGLLVLFCFFTRSRGQKNISAVDQSIVDFIYRRQDIEDPEDFKIVEQVHQEK